MLIHSYSSFAAFAYLKQQKYKNICGTQFSRYLFCVRLYKCLVHSYSSFGSVNACYPQFRFCYRYAQGAAAKVFGSTVTVNDDSGAAISPIINRLIQSSVAESIGALTDNLAQVIEDRLGGFARRFSEENGSTV